MKKINTIYLCAINSLGMRVNMNLSKRFYLVLAFVCSLVPSLAYADKILDKVEIVQAQNETEIHIEFLTQVRYLRHAPLNTETSRIQIFLEFPQLTKETLSNQREFRNSPKTNLVPRFTVNYPEQETNSIGVRFKSPVKFAVTPDNSGRGIVIHVPNDKAGVVTEPVVEPPVEPVIDHGPQGEIPAKPADMSDNDYASKLMAEARVARGFGDYPKAVQLLNAVLALPSNSHSQDAQELIANSREKMGEMTKAKAEYETYLKLYPQGEGATRVRQRLTALEGSGKFSSADAAKIKKPIRDIHENTVYGSWNQYYYDAHSHNYPGSGKNTGTHDQSQLVSAIDLTARFRQNEWDSRIVIRDTQTMDFLPNKADRNRLQAAYVEVQNKESDFMTRLGRQNGYSGGVLGRFDGGLFRYGLSPQYKLNFVAGTLDEYNIDYRRHFYGINLDIGPINEKWSGNAFFIEQRVDDLIDRRGVGGELRYFDMGKSLYSVVDYDTYFNRLNTAMVQGNWQPVDGTSYNILMESRKSPVLQLINALFDPAFQNQTFYPTTPTSLRQALQIGSTISAPNTLTVTGLRDYAINQTLDTSLFLVGATRQMTPRWQLGGDVQMSRVTGSSNASNGAIALAKKAAADNGTFLSDLDIQNLTNSFAGGNTYTYHVQAVGLNTLFKDDTSIIGLSYVDGPTSRVQSVVLTNVMVPRDKWRLDSSVKLLRIESDPSSVQYVVGPTVRASYRLREKATIEAEVGLEVTNENSSDSFNPGHTRTFRDFSFIGYRLDI
jgi:tetratricopeptide (TPR) repeat protein